MFILSLTLISIYIILIIYIKKTNKKAKINKKNALIFFTICILLTTPSIKKLKTNKTQDDNVLETYQEITTQTTKDTIIGETTKGYKIEYIDGAYYINGTLIVNKKYQLKDTFIPKNTTKEIPKNGFTKEPLDKEAYQAWIEMKTDAEALGLNLWAQSGYRSYNYQKELYNGYVSKKGKEAADTFSARPGASEHQTGLAFDLNTITNSFKDTKEGKWVNDNCYLYGYIIRYPEGKTNETGYIFEPWHIRYVGKILAEKLYNNGSWITMESYFGIDSKYID